MKKAKTSNVDKESAVVENSSKGATSMSEFIIVNCFNYRARRKQIKKSGK